MTNSVDFDIECPDCHKVHSVHVTVKVRDPSATCYKEPKFKYVIVKTTDRMVEECGSLYEAARGSWYNVSLDTVKDYKYVFAVIGGIVQEVFVAESWKPSGEHRVQFTGKPAPSNISTGIKGRRIPDEYRKPGLCAPILLSKN